MAEQSKRQETGNTEPAMSIADVKAHYESLISFFKWLVAIALGALAVIASIGLYFFHKDISEFRSEAQVAVDRSRDLAGAQISKIRDEAASIALKEARDRVDEAFKATNIHTMVESAARRQVGPAINRQVRESVDQAMRSLQTEIGSLGQLADLGMRARMGYRSALDGLIAMANSASDDEVRRRAAQLLESIATDYENVTLAISGRGGSLAVASGFEPYEPQRWKGDKTAVSHWVKEMRKAEDVYALTSAFLALRDLTGYHFKMFDVGAVEKWCGEHKPVCD